MRMAEEGSLEKCDKCGSDILMGECSCGLWFDKGKAPKFVDVFQAAILEFAGRKQDILSGDHAPSGCCVVFFKGDYKKCMKVVDFIASIS